MKLIPTTGIEINKERIMKVKAINAAILAIGLNLPLVSIADTTQSTAEATPSSTTAPVSQDTALSQPNKSDSEIVAWANSTAVATFTYNFENYREKIQNLSGFFTDSGWKEFMSALDKSKNLDAIKDKKLAVSAVATGSPIILQKGSLNNVYSWRVQLPMLITYQGAKEYSKQYNIVTMLITRTSSVNAPTGVAINQFIIGPANSDKK